MFRLLIGLVVILATLPAAAESPLTTPIAGADLDPAAFAEWVEGAEKPVSGAGPQNVFWTRDANPGDNRPRWNGVVFGETKTPGPRHLRIGFKRPVPVGTVLASVNARVSVLKADAEYPGNLTDESQWIPAERLTASGAVQTEREQAEPTVWILPPATTTRALRFTHVAEITEKSYAAHLHGVAVLEPRLANVAPWAAATASANEPRFALLNNERHDDWGTWEAWDEKAPPPPVTERPAWVMLTWPEPVSLCGLMAVWAGFGGVEAQAYIGPASRVPKEAVEADWQTVARTDQLDSLYPFRFAPQWIDFGRTISTRAVRLKITRPTREGHPHLQGSTHGGRRVWLGELLALRPLEAQPSAVAIPKPIGDEPPPIAVHFDLSSPGLVTLVIEDAEGRRVRNLVSETPFPAGKHTVGWDGLDDSQRDGEAARHGLYHVTGNFVAPGNYRVRGLVAPRLDLRYEFPIYTAGDPAWQTADHTGGWLSNHTPPQSAVFLPDNRAPDGKPLVFLGSFVSEGTHGLAWVDLEGKKVGGMNWVGGAWTGAPYLARDDGPAAVAGVQVYVASTWESDKKTRQGELRVTALAAGERPVVRHRFTASGTGEVDYGAEMSGLAARNGLVYVAMPKQDKVLVVDARQAGPKSDGQKPSGSVLGSFALADPRGLAFDSQGNLWALSGKRLVRADAAAVAPERLDKPLTVETVAADLEDPKQLALDADGHVYVSDWGQSHQVKVHDRTGRRVQTIGKPGEPKAGPYDRLKMNHPFGITIDDRGRLWVAEMDEQPKRISVWKPDGTLDRAFYGPSAYGGGGKLDPLDPSRFYYRGMEFALDWQQGGFTLRRVFFRPEKNDAMLGGHMADGYPEEPLTLGGRRYFSNCYNSNPTNGAGLSLLWIDRDGLARPVAAFGRANDWALLKDEAFRSRWPEGHDPKGDYWRNQAAVLWSDGNGDGQAQPSEVTIVAGSVGGVTIMPDGAWVASRFEGRAVRLPTTGLNAHGAPLYDFQKQEILAEKVEPPHSSGGDQALVHPSGWTVLTLGCDRFSPFSVSGAFRGRPRWSYPDLWPGLHASHEAPVPDRPGMLIGTTRLLGGFVEAGEAGPVWFLNGNMGTIYVFTADGLLVQTLFRDFRLGRPWSMPTARRGMLLNEVTSEGENFWPSVTQTADGRVFLCDGGRTSLVRVEGLEKVRRLADRELQVTEPDLAAARAWTVRRETQRQQREGLGTLPVPMRSAPPRVDGKLDDWSGAQWATIDKRGAQAWFDSNSRPYDVTAAICVAGDRLYMAVRTGEPELLRNTGELPLAPFKTGGALDLMLATNPKAAADRTEPAEGDLRLLITRVAAPGKAAAIRAVLYRAVVPGTAADRRTPFSSPSRTIYFDRVDDVSSQVELAGEGNFEVSVPLAALGVSPRAGLRLRGDVGILRGDGAKTIQRVYWSNKATSIVTDVPSEAALAPNLWGWFEFQ